MIGLCCGRTLYQTYDFAQFLKNNEKFEQSIKFYSNVLQKIPKSHELYPRAKDGRGIAYEQIGNWAKAEKDFLDSLEAKPDQAYVINYLAYSWIEKGVQIEKSLEMLKEANKLRSNDGYITDSLGWALYKLKKYKEAKVYLKLDRIKNLTKNKIKIYDLVNKIKKRKEFFNNLITIDVDP